MLFHSTFERKMVNTGSENSPFLFAAIESREYFLGRLRYCIIETTKEMENIRSESKPYFVKSVETFRIKILGIWFRGRSQYWIHPKLCKNG